MTDEELEEKCSQILDKALSSDAEFLHFMIWVMSERVKKIVSEQPEIPTQRLYIRLSCQGEMF